MPSRSSGRCRKARVRRRQTRRRALGGRASRSTGALVRNARRCCSSARACSCCCMFTPSRPGPAAGAGAAAGVHAATPLQLTTELAADYPNRVPGTAGATRAAGWYQDRLALYGLAATPRRWREDVPGLGDGGARQPRHGGTGHQGETIVVVAHRDNRGTSSGANDNASGTAALVELLRGYAATGTLARRLEPEHTLVFLSSDGGAYGALGAQRFATTSPLAERAVAVSRSTGSQVAHGPGSSSALRRRARRALARADGHRARPGAARRRSCATRACSRNSSISVCRSATASRRRSCRRPFRIACLDRARRRRRRSGRARGTIDPQRLGQLGRAAETTLASLDGAIQLSGQSAAFVYVGDRVVRGWAVELCSCWPVAVRRGSRRPARTRRAEGTRLAPAWVDLRRRLGLARPWVVSSSWRRSPASFRSASRPRRGRRAAGRLPGR